MRFPVPTFRAALAPSAIALVLRLAVACTAPLEPTWDGVIYERAAVEISEGHGYTRRVLDPSNAPEPSAFYPVGFPAILAGLRVVGGDRRSDLVFQALVGAAIVPLAFLLARRSAGLRAARIAAWLVALWPGGILLSGSWLAEPLVAFAIGIALVPLAYARPRRWARAVAVSGALAGLGAYLRVTPLAIVPIAAATFVLGRRIDRPSIARASLAAIVCFACALVPLAPWVARNARALGAPVLVSTNGGANLLLGTIGDGSFQPIPPELDCPKSLPEVPRDACRRGHALARLRAEPVAWLVRGLAKLSHTFGHESAPAQTLDAAMRQAGAERPSLALAWLSIGRLYWVVLFGLAIGGFAAVWRGPSLARAILIAPPLGLALLHFVTIGGDRYHPAVVPSLAVLAAIAIDRLVPRRVPCSPRGTP